jgi:hypothetical protein
MADIHTELSNIANGRYGVDIRMPIHSALDKINQEVEYKKGGEDDGGDNSGTLHNSE